MVRTHTSDTSNSQKETTVCPLEDLILAIDISLLAAPARTDTEPRGIISIWCLLL